MPIFQVGGMREAIGAVRGPVILIANLLTEGRGMRGFTAGDAVHWTSDALGRPVDVVITNTARPSDTTLARYADEHKEPLDRGEIPPGCELIEGPFWCREIARHDRRRLAYAVWSFLSRQLLQDGNVRAGF